MLDKLIEASGVEPSRIRILNGADIPSAASFVIYWMRFCHRAEMNPSLNLAIDIANILEVSVVVLFNYNKKIFSANAGQNEFMMDGILEVKSVLADKKIQMLVSFADSLSFFNNLLTDAALIVTDAGYMKNERLDNKCLLFNNCAVIEVESSIVVPLTVLSGKEEYSAATLRPRIQKVLPFFLNPEPDPLPKHSSIEINFRNVKELFYSDSSEYTGNNTGSHIKKIRGGSEAARKVLGRFIKDKLDVYSRDRNNPDLEGSSGLSPYLHFGHISPVKIAIDVLKETKDYSSLKVFLDELIIRRELSYNFVCFNNDYDNLDSLPLWAKETLALNKDVKREHIYSLDEFENSHTHDPYWNAAQNQLVMEGTIHNYMRMYWGKKFIEWSPSPDVAYEYMVYLNNRYALDGNDSNSYAGIAWCFGKHDRPYSSRPVFGKVRYMNANGIKRKFKMNAYMEKYQFRFDSAE